MITVHIILIALSNHPDNVDILSYSSTMMPRKRWHVFMIFLAWYSMGWLSGATVYCALHNLKPTSPECGKKISDLN
jgi:hypothetical protein